MNQWIPSQQNDQNEEHFHIFLSVFYKDGWASNIGFFLELILVFLISIP